MSVRYRLNRLLAADGRCFDVAIDHGIFNEPTFLGGIDNTQSVTTTPLSTTTPYTITVTSGVGCTASAMRTVNVNPLPTASLSGGGTVCASDPLPDVVFTFTGGSPRTGAIAAVWPRSAAATDASVRSRRRAPV